MPESGEDQRMEMFFKNVIKSFGELQATKALQQQADMVANTIGGHVREVLGPVQEGVDIIKNTFQNTWGFVKGAMDDLGNFFGLDEKIEEKVYRGTSLQQGAEIIEESQRSNEMFIQGQEAEWERFEAQMDAFARMYDIEQEIVNEVKEGFKELYGAMGESTKLAKEELTKKKEERLEEMRSTKKKDRTFAARVFDLVMAVIFGPFAIIAGLIAGFVATFAKVLFFPLRVVKGLARTFGFLGPAVGKLEKSTGFFGKLVRFAEEIPILGKFFGYLAKNRWIGKMFGLGKFVGSKILFPLFLFFDAISGLKKYKKIFGDHAGLREAIESAIAGIVSGLTQLPAKALDWVIKKVTGLETNFAQYFTVESLAKGLHRITSWFDDTVVKPIKSYVEDPETQKRWDELQEATERAVNAFNNMIKGWKDKLDGWWEKNFGEEARKKALEEWEKQTPEQRQIALGEVSPGEMEFGLPRPSKLTPEELAANREAFENSPMVKFFSNWWKDTTDIRGKTDRVIEGLTDTMNTLTSILEGKGITGEQGQQLVQNISSATGMVGGGAGAAGAQWSGGNYYDPKEELPNAGVLLQNKQ